MKSLTNNDYKTILEYYGIIVPSTLNKDIIKKKAESILANKLCRCIKKVQKTRKNKSNETKSIAICKNSVLKKKKLRSFLFKCKNKPRFLSQKGTRRKLVKIGKMRLKKKTRRSNKK
jgi:hypothetical protein